MRSRSVSSFRSRSRSTLTDGTSGKATICLFDHLLGPAWMTKNPSQGISCPNGCRSISVSPLMDEKPGIEFLNCIDNFISAFHGILQLSRAESDLALAKFIHDGGTSCACPYSLPRCAGEKCRGQHRASPGVSCHAPHRPVWAWSPRNKSPGRLHCLSLRGRSSIPDHKSESHCESSLPHHSQNVLVADDCVLLIVNLNDVASPLGKSDALAASDLAVTLVG